MGLSMNAKNIAGAILMLIGGNNLAFSARYFYKHPLVEPCGTVCVQVFSYNEREYIEKCLSSILEQDIIRAYPNRFRLQVFDGGSTDGTIEVAKDYGFEVIVLERGKLRARNYSVVAYPECWVHVHVDADTFFPSWWLRNVLWHFQYPDVVAVTTARLYYNPLLMPIMTVFRGFYNFERKVFGSNCAVRHDVFMENLFDTSYDGKENMVDEEEIRFYERLSRYGRIVYEPTPAFTRTCTRKYLF